MTIAGNDQIGASRKGALENSVVIRIGQDDVERDVGLHNCRYTHEKLQLNHDLGIGPFEKRSQHISQFSNDRGAKPEEYILALPPAAKVRRAHRARP
jgi:hypothetical protein